MFLDVYCCFILIMCLILHRCNEILISLSLKVAFSLTNPHPQNQKKKKRNWQTHKMGGIKLNLSVEWPSFLLRWTGQYRCLRLKFDKFFSSLFGNSIFPSQIVWVYEWSFVFLFFFEALEWLASDELVHESDNKRLNARQVGHQFLIWVADWVIDTPR